MAKRLTGTDKWDKAWFRKLEPKYKCFWEYIRDKCDLVGLWEIDFESASFHIGDKINEVDVLKIFDTKLKKIEDKILIMDFCHFQYGEVLNLKSPIHKKIKDILDKHTLYDTLYNRVVNTLQVKEEDKDKDNDSIIDIEKLKIKYLENEKLVDVIINQNKEVPYNTIEKLEKGLNNFNIMLKSKGRLVESFNKYAEYFLNWSKKQEKNIYDIPDPFRS